MQDEINEHFTQSFKDYLTSTKLLKEMAQNNYAFESKHEVTKYCKVPLLLIESAYKKEYVSLKPKDIITISWGIKDGKAIIENLKIAQKNGTIQTLPQWYTVKMKSWALNNTNQLLD